MAPRPRVSTRLAEAGAYSYRRDPAVPPFPDDKPLIVHDGVCVLCSTAMRVIARRDRQARYRYASAQSMLGQALFRHYGLDPASFETVLLLDDGRAYGKLDMARRIAARIGGIYRGFGLFAVLPGALQDWCYDRIAKNRYRLFGRSDSCILPDPSWRARVIDQGELA
jgi:predicted DCC family thiol-disulfide oxidoreductase YuxK